MNLPEDTTEPKQGTPWNWCQRCNQLVDADDVFDGSEVKCLKCGREFICVAFRGGTWALSAAIDSPPAPAPADDGLARCSAIVDGERCGGHPDCTEETSNAGGAPVCAIDCHECGATVEHPDPATARAMWQKCMGASAVERFVNHKRYAGISSHRMPDGRHWVASTAHGESYPGETAEEAALAALAALKPVSP